MDRVLLIALQNLSRWDVVHKDEKIPLLTQLFLHSSLYG